GGSSPGARARSPLSAAAQRLAIRAAAGGYGRVSTSAPPEDCPTGSDSRHVATSPGSLRTAGGGLRESRRASPAPTRKDRPQPPPADSAGYRSLRSGNRSPGAGIHGSGCSASPTEATGVGTAPSLGGLPETQLGEGPCSAGGRSLAPNARGDR